MAQVETSVMIKLALFTTAMFAAPILTYYQTIDRIFDGTFDIAPVFSYVVRPPLTFHLTGNATYAAGSAAVVANVVLFSYIIVAALEDPVSEEEKASWKKPIDKPKDE